MKGTLLTFILLILTTTVFSQSIIIGDDGIVRCKDVTIGTTQTIFGDTYEVVDRNLLIQRRDEGKDLTKVCVSNVTVMIEMFHDRNFNQPIGNWDVSNVTDMLLMFTNSSFNQPIGSWNVSLVTNMAYMFRGSQFNQPIANWDVGRVTYMSHMFRDSKFNQSIQHWNVSSVTDMLAMFTESDFNQPIGNWDVRNVRNMSMMFQNTSFNHPLDNWEVSNVTDMSQMFFLSQFNQPIAKWDVSSVSDMRRMFNQSRFNQPIGNWNVGSVTDMNGMFFRAPFNQLIEDWDVSNVTHMSLMFSETPFNQPIGNWDVSNVTNMSSMFYSTPFNQDIANWDVTNVRSMDQMFRSSRFNQSINQWCVVNISSEPVDFSSGAPLIQANKPVWGWCPGTPAALNQLFPQNNSTEINPLSQISWSQDSLSTKYQLQLFEGVDPLVIDVTQSNSFFSPQQPLKSNQEYNWRVRGINENKIVNGEPLTGKWSSIWKFTTKMEPVSKITLGEPQNNSTNISVNTILRWNKDPNAQSYSIQISTDGFSTFVLNENAADSLFIVKDLSFLTEYQWRVRGINTLGEGDWSSVWNFTTEIEPEIINLLSPSNDVDLYEGDIIFSWSNVESAQFYTLQLSDNNTFDVILIDTTISNPNALKTGTTTQNGSSATALIGERGDNFSGSLPSVTSKIWFGFTVNEINSLTHFRFIPPEGFGYFNVRIISPENSVLSSRNIDSFFEYSVPTFTVGTYFISISVTDAVSLFHNPGSFIFKTSKNSFTTSEGDSLSLSLNINKPDTFFWRVQFDDDTTKSDWSPIWSFTTVAFTSINTEEVPTLFALNQNYPNPFNPTTQIQFSLPVSTVVRLDVFSVLGQRTVTLLNEHMPAGVHTVPFDGKSLSSGVYIYRLTTPEFTQSRLMNLVK